jgi:hypothetical protein
MAKLNYNRPNNGYEKEPWARQKFKSANTGLARTIHKETILIRGKYQGSRIDTIVKNDPNYCIWILDNQPKGIVAQQLQKYFNRQK